MPKRPPTGDLPATRAEYEASPNKTMGLSKAQIKAQRKAARGTAVAATKDGVKVTKTTKLRTDPRWPNPKVNGSKRAKSPRGAKLTIAENVKIDEPKVTSNNIFPKVTQKWKDKK